MSGVVAGATVGFGAVVRFGAAPETSALLCDAAGLLEGAAGVAAGVVLSEVSVLDGWLTLFDFFVVESEAVDEGGEV